MLNNQQIQNITSFNNELKFPDGTGFYPDVQNGIRGYNTDPERGADTFSPFSDIAMPFTSAFFLGAANFATSYQYVYAELKIPVGKSSKTFTATCSGNSNDNRSILSVTGSDGKTESIHPGSSSQTMVLDISASEYVIIKFDKPERSNTITYWCNGEYTIE